MATEYSFYIFPLSENELPETPINRQSFDHGIMELISNKLDEKVVLQGLSRNDWVRWTFKRLFEVCHEDCLTFLIEEWIILKPEQVQTTAHELRLFCQRLQNHPEIFHEATGYRCDNDIAYSFLHAKQTLDPYDGGDGDSVFYFVHWLVCAIDLLEEASKNHYYVMSIHPMVIW